MGHFSDQNLVGDTRSSECKAHFDFYFGEEVNETSIRIPIKVEASRENLIPLTVYLLSPYLR